MTDLEPMTVQNPTQALELLAKDAGPLQSYREITHNAIQAIQATGNDGEILWDVDWITVGSAIDAGDEPIYLLSCADTGEGMSPEEQLKYINQLFVSGRDQATDKNFGIGAKVTAGAKNPAGVEYRSWKDGVASRIYFERDDGGTYGLRRFEHGGKVNAWAPVPAVAKPQVIGDHGTVVVLHGTTGADHTITPPSPATPGGMKWLARFLNQRYFEFPPGIRIRARELPADRSNWPTTVPMGEDRAGSLRTVTGMRHWLESHKAKDLGDLPTSGVAHLADGARVHWWILDTDTSSDVYWARGHSAALFQSEIYDSAEAQPHRIRMQQFGVIFASRRIALYVEPAGDVTATIARDSLRLGGEPLPWERWGTSFRADLPASISEVERRIREEASTADHSRAIEDRLKAYQDLFKITSWRASERGPDKAWGDALSGQGAHRSGSLNGGSSGGSRSTGGGGTARRDYLSTLDDEGVSATQISPRRDIPKVEWVRFSTTEQPSDRAGEYVPEKNTIYANTEFRVFTDMAARISADFPNIDDETAEQTVTGVVQEWYGQVLVEAVIRSWNFEHEQRWQNVDYDRLISPEGLTMAVLPFSFLYGRLKQVVGSMVGKPSSPTNS